MGKLSESCAIVRAACSVAGRVCDIVDKRSDDDAD